MRETGSETYSRGRHLPAQADSACARGRTLFVNLFRILFAITFVYDYRNLA